METDASHPYASPSQCEPLPVQRPLLRSARFWIPAVICLIAIFLTAPVAFIIGAIAGNTQIYNNFANHQQARIESYLREDPAAFGDLIVEHASNGWAYLSGTVPTQEDYDRLSQRLHQMFGDELAEAMLRNVRVQE